MFQLGNETPYSHVHLFQSSQSADCQAEELDVRNEEQFNIGAFNPGSSVRVLGKVSAFRMLTPTFDQAYRAVLKAKTDSMARPGLKGRFCCNWGFYY